MIYNRGADHKEGGSTLLSARIHFSLPLFGGGHLSYLSVGDARREAARRNACEARGRAGVVMDLPHLDRCDFS